VTKQRIWHGFTTEDGEFRPSWSPGEPRSKAYHGKPVGGLVALATRVTGPHDCPYHDGTCLECRLCLVQLRSSTKKEKNCP
jgi:hypothetical protein